MDTQKYKLRFFVEWGGDCIWPDTSDQRTYEKFACGPIAPKRLGVSQVLCDELKALETEYQTSLNWDDPSAPSPWEEEHWIDYFQRLQLAYKKLCIELKDKYDIAYCESESIR